MSLLAQNNVGGGAAFQQFVASISKQHGFAPMRGRIGGQIRAASLKSLKQHLATMRKHISGSGHLFGVDFGYVDSPVPTAFADRFGEVHVVGMHTALATAIYESNLLSFAQNDIFPEIGDLDKSSVPSVDPGGRAGGFWLEALRRETMATVRPGDTIPKCPMRRAAAYYVSLLTMRFVWLHEVAHGLEGHVDYLRSLQNDGQKTLQRGGLHLMQLSDLDASVDGRMLQLMEFEADNYAICESILMQENKRENIEGFSAWPLSLRIRLTLFGINNLTWLFERLSAIVYRSHLDVTHPAPIWRFQRLQTLAKRTLNIVGIDGTRMTTDTLTQFDFVQTTVGTRWRQFKPLDTEKLRSDHKAMQERLALYRYNPT